MFFSHVYTVIFNWKSRSLNPLLLISLIQHFHNSACFIDGILNIPIFFCLTLTPQPTTQQFSPGIKLCVESGLVGGELGWAGKWWLSSKSIKKSSQETFNTIFAFPRRNQFFATLLQKNAFEAATKENFWTYWRKPKYQRKPLSYK